MSKQLQLHLLTLLGVSYSGALQNTVLIDWLYHRRINFAGEWGIAANQFT